MTYDRYESRRGWREPRSRYAQDYGDRYQARSFDRDDADRQDRGFLDRAGDEIASWFGDEEAERRRREDARFRPDEDSWRGPPAFRDDEDVGRYDRQARFRSEGYRRPYTGRFTGRRSFGDDDRFDRGWSERWEKAPSRDFTGTAYGLHDPHYSEWRRRQIDALDRDYDEYRRENQSRFEDEFSSWRTTRQVKRQLLGEIREHMPVVGSDDEEVGKVDYVLGDRVVLTKDDSPDGRHHAISCTLIDHVDSDRVVLDQPAATARQRFDEEGRTSGFFRDDRDEDRGPHILNRAFAGTYER